MNGPTRNDEARRQPGNEAEQDSKLNRNDTSTENQRQIILEALRAGSQDTVTLRAEYGIMSPAPRIFELRHKFGYDIDRVNITRFTDDGVKHCRVALYILKPSVDLIGEVMQ
ncbi:MAG: helix-turn-helix domain-containing protein [Pseudomonadota bacterium]